MGQYIDLSHTIEEDISVFKNLQTPKIHALFSHEESKKFYNNKAMFEVTKMEFQTSCGTYIDSPYHRHPDMHDISKIKLEQTILRGLSWTYLKKGLEPISLEDVPQNIRNKAALFSAG